MMIKKLVEIDFQVQLCNWRAYGVWNKFRLDQRSFTATLQYYEKQD